MANNGNFNIVDPNKEGNGLQPLEDLNIDVQLTVNTRGRKNQERKTIKFIDGTITNSNGTKSLSTNFTEIGTSFGDRTDLETLGIKSINIDFNASYTPMVKITFIDLRGDSIITKGDKSKYNFFFQLPYPVFELKIKGFYGKAVTYCLNMTKFNSKFNSDGGHFEINCDFIGYTYAFLSDMLMGYMKAITNTDIGKDKFDSIVKDINSTLDNPVPVPTLSDFIINASKLNTDLEKLKDSDDYILLSKTIGAISELNDLKNFIRNNIYDGIATLSELTKVGENINSNDDHKLQVFSISNTSNLYNKESKNSAPLFEKLRDKIKSFNKNVGAKYKLNEEKAFKGLPTLNDDGQSAKIRITIHSTGDANGIEVNNSKVVANGDWTLIANELINNRDLTTVYIYDFTAIIDEINNRDTELKKLKSELENIVSNLTSDLTIDIFGDFNPTLRNIILMLTAHAETLIESINDVSDNINISNRPKSLKDAAKNNLLTDTFSGGDVVYPFPNYAKDGINLSWIGELDSGLPEVEYVDNLLDAMIRQQKTEKSLIEGLGSGTSYYPINVYDNYIDKTNPYLLLNDTAEVKDSLLAVILRASTFFLTSLNPKKRIHTSLTSILNDGDTTEHKKEEVELVARVEARSLFNSLVFDDKSNNKIFDYLDSLGSDDSSFYDKVKSLITNPNFIDGPNLGTTFSNPIFEYNSTDKKFVYKFLTDDSKNEQIIPFTDDLRSRTIAKTTYSEGDNFVNLLSNSSINSFDIRTVGDNTYTFPTLPSKPNSDDEFVSNQASLKISEDTYYGEYVTESKLNFNFGNTDGTPNEITIYGGENDSYKYRTLKISEFEDISTQNNNYINFYYNVNDIGFSFGAFELFKPHMTGMGLQKANEVYDSSLVGSITSKPIAYDKNPIDNDEDTFSFYESYKDKNIGRRLALFGLGGEEDRLVLDTIYLSNVSGETSTGYFSGRVSKPITLFGSEFYNKQKSDRAKSLLYLNSIPFKVGEDLDILISKYLNRQGGLIQVPYMLMVLIGGMLWRNNQTVDPILYYKDDSGNTTSEVTTNHMASINIGVELTYPKLDEFFIVEQSNTTNNSGNNIPYLYHLTFLNKKDENSTRMNYAKLPKSITSMNDTLKDKFIEVYETWLLDLDNGWASIKDELELTLINKFSNWEGNVNGTTIGGVTGSVSNTNYKFIGKILPDEKNTYNTNNTNVVTLLREKTLVNNELNPASTSTLSLLLKTRQIFNATPQIWNTDKDSEKYFDASIKENFMEIYIKNFYTELIKLKDDKTKEDKKIKEQTKNVNSSELESLKLNVYRNIKAIHDKWLGDGNTPTKAACGVDGSLFNSFNIIDKFYDDIGDKVIINPKKFVDNILSNSNTSLASFLSKFLASMNFDFIALPNFVDLSDEKNIKEMFEPLPYTSNASSIGPSFICMYVGDTSKNLKLGNSNSGDPDSDGSDVKTDKNFASSSLELPGAAFLIRYGQQNQSIFKDLELNQEEFTETDEGLIATDALSNPNSIKNGTFINQSLFNIYSTRSYNCGVTAMGNAMIQPMTYFQLENVPMFRGAYLIKNVSHTINANTMDTKFTGTRITKYRIPLLDKNTVYLNMLGSINALTDSNTSLSADLSRSTGGGNISFINTETTTGVQTLSSINETTPVIDNNINNGIIYV